MNEKMKSKANGSMQRAQMMDRVNGDGPNWILIAGGALLSTLSIRIGCKLKQALEAKGLNKESRGHANGVQIKQVSDNPISKEPELSLPLVKISAGELNKDSNGGALWAFSPELLELPHKPFHHSTGSDSPSISESGSDIYTKREVINKLRQQLKRRDEMIMDMQNQIADLQNSLCTQMSQVVQTQSQLDSANQELFESEREIQRLRKVIANHCILKSNSPEKLTSVANRRPETANGFPDTVNDLDLHCFGLQKVKGDEDRVLLLKKELGDLSAVIERKDFLLQSYQEQKRELCSTIKALEHRLESHQQNIF
ncbi:hypothetical protein KFK09_024141 [Dendrobium nobile]|uniref:Uncharacterized protein n=1 Tax=Dendrobium nobile TaxID=94219 RepID=A0A8T3ACY0_DENNO|nr:hypothetical protein KFK09_024141 [Dendrobium nobile]